MSNLTSLIPQGSPIPDPPHLKIIGIVIAVLFSMVMVFLMLFIVFEFSLDMAGTPLDFSEKVPKDLDPEGRKAGNSILSPDEITSHFHLLSPLDKTRIVSPETTVLCYWKPPENRLDMPPPITMQLYVDEFPVAWEMCYGNNAWVSNLHLRPGEHRLRTLAFEATFFVEESDDPEKQKGPENWKILRSHENIGDVTQCYECHEMIEGSNDLVRPGRSLTVGPWKGHQTCLSCHPVSHFEQQHDHPFAPIQDCRLCHQVHGTTVSTPSLLKAPKKIICAECHVIE